MGQRQYVYQDLNSLSDESLATLLSSCPYPLLALVMKATPEAMKERMLSLLNGDKRRLVLNDSQRLDLGLVAENRSIPIVSCPRLVG